MKNNTEIIQNKENKVIIIIINLNIILKIFIIN